MQRRALVLAALAAAVAPRASDAQPAKKVWRVGYLSMASPEADRHWVTALREGLRDLGYIEGQNIILELRHASNRADKVPELAAEFAQDRKSVV